MGSYDNEQQVRPQGMNSTGCGLPLRNRKYIAFACSILIRSDYVGRGRDPQYGAGKIYFSCICRPRKSHCNGTCFVSFSASCNSSCVHNDSVQDNAFFFATDILNVFVSMQAPERENTVSARL